MASLSVLPALSVAVSVVSVVNVHGCKTESDCSLNGLCTGGACRCDQPWSGPACATLDFEPAPAGGMYGFGTPFHTSSWGGNAVEDGGLWHLFVTEIAGAGCGLHKWGQQSTVTHATSKVPEGPYEKQGLALPHQAHNPQAIKIGEWWHIFHIGGALNNTAISPCNETVLPVPLPPHQLPVSLGGGSGSAKGGGATLHRSRSPFGPWEPVVGCPALNNPSPFLHPNGSLFLVGSRPFEMRSSLSGSSTGPWSDPISMNPDKVGSIPGGHWEDPFLFVDSRNNFHIIAHVWGNLNPFPYNPISGHGYSPDGFNWTWSPTEPYTNAVARVDGTVQRFATLERPKLLFADPANPTRPTHLTNGASPVWMAKVGGADSCWPSCSNATDACHGCGWCSHCKQQQGGRGGGGNLDWTYTLLRPLSGSKERG